MCVGATEHMLEEGTNGKHLEVTPLEGYVHSLSRNHRAYLLRARESVLAEWFCPILAFLRLELGAHKNHSDMEMFLRGNFVKQCYFYWQNSRCFVLVHLLQFLIYLTQMPGIINK